MEFNTAPEPVRHTIKINRRKKDGSLNLTGLQVARLEEAAKQGTGGGSPGKETTWELDGSMIVWDLTDKELSMAVAYLGQLGSRRVIEVTRLKGAVHVG